MLSYSPSRATQGAALVVLTTMLWGTSFALLKGAIGEISPAVLIGVRFAIAAVALAPWLRCVNPRLLRDGALLGAIYFAETTSALNGLETISANRSAFIISLNVIFVPILAALLGRRLPPSVLVAALLALAGVGVMAWDGDGLAWGDVFTLGSALGVAVYLLVLERVAPRHGALPLAAVQITVMALLGLVVALPELAAQGIAIADQMGTLVYLGLVVTVAPLWTQALAQRWIPAHRAALLGTLEPVFAALVSFWLLGEQLGWRGLLGAGCILGAMLFSQWGDSLPPSPRSDELGQGGLG
ncbi:MAG: DMT family transporter [Cyanobacteria bacterium P01_A01_bin.135]